MLTTRLSLAGALTLVLASSGLAQQSPLDSLRFRTFSNSSSNEASSVVEIDASGAVELRRDYGPNAALLGPPEPTLRTQLTPAERDMLDTALRAPGLAQVPRLTRSRTVGYARVQLDVRFADGRPPLVTAGRLGRYGDHDALLLPIEAVVQEVTKRLRASDTELTLKIERCTMPDAILADETVQFEIEGSGQPGLEFVGARVRLSKRYLTVSAVARQVPLAPAQPFRAQVSVPRAGRVGRGYLIFKLSPKHFSIASSRWIRIYHAVQPADGIYTGKIRKGEQGATLELDTGRDTNRKLTTERLPLDAAASDLLGRFEGEVVQFKGSVDASGRLSVDELRSPTRHSLQGIALHAGYGVHVDDFGNLHAVGPAAWNLSKIESGTWVELEGWVFEIEQVTPPRKGWWDTGGKSLHLKKRVWVERIKARVTAGAKLKKGWRTVGRVQPGDEVWVSNKRAFGWSVNVTNLDGTLAGRMRTKRLDFARAAASGSAAPTVGIVGGLPSGQ